MIYIGIDPGTKTGIAVWDATKKEFFTIGTLTIYEAINYCNSYEFDYTTIIMEDARLRKWYGNSGREKLQGAGSVKRDCAIWEEVFPNIIKVAPKNNKTKLDQAAFERLTGWKGRTSVHGRDAAMLVFGK
jgi:hypothetical protein